MDTWSIRDSVHPKSVWLQFTLFKLFWHQFIKILLSQICFLNLVYVWWVPYAVFIYLFLMWGLKPKICSFLEQWITTLPCTNLVDNFSLGDDGLKNNDYKRKICNPFNFIQISQTCHYFMPKNTCASIRWEFLKIQKLKKTKKLDK